MTKSNMIKKITKAHRKMQELSKKKWAIYKDLVKFLKITRYTIEKDYLTDHLYNNYYTSTEIANMIIHEKQLRDSYNES